MNTIKQTFTKNIFTFLMLSAAALTFTNRVNAHLSNEVITACYEDQVQGAWKYIEFKFIEEPKQAIENATLQFNVNLSAFCAFLFLGNKYTATTKKEIKEDKEVSTVNEYFPSDNASIIASGILIAAGAYAQDCKIEASIKRKTLVNFLKDLSYHRDFMPEELLPAFDEIALGYENSKTISSAQVNQIFAIIQHLVEHSFEKRYPKGNKSASMLDSLKKLTEIGKNIGGK